MNDELIETNNALIYFQGRSCPYCGVNSHYQVSIELIEVNDTGWDLRGTGKPIPATIEYPCSSCGMMFETLRYTIPIECASFPCPKCGELQNLEYKVQRIQAEKGFFQFEAIISCRKCDTIKSFKEVLKKILGVLKITVGPAGITVSKS